LVSFYLREEGKEETKKKLRRKQEMEREKRRERRSEERKNEDKKGTISGRRTDRGRRLYEGDPWIRWERNIFVIFKAWQSS